MKLLDPKATYSAQMEYVYTFVHECLHALAFNGEAVKGDPSKTNIKNLNLLTSTVSDAYVDGHWNEAYLPNDVMVSFSRAGAVVTAFTLELFRLRSVQYQTSMQYVPYNFYLDRMDDMTQLFNYKCSPNEARPKFSSFCSTEMKNSRKAFCSGDYLYKAGCSGNPLVNGCFAKVSLGDQNCLDENPSASKAVFEHRGVDARCFEIPTIGAYCLKYRISSPTTVTVILGLNEVTCKNSGEMVSGMYRDSRGVENPVQFKCPDIPDFVEAEKHTRCPNMCFQNGFCSRGRCVCFEGYNKDTNCEKTLDTQTTNQNFSEMMK